MKLGRGKGRKTKTKKERMREQEKRLAEDCVDHYLIGSGYLWKRLFFKQRGCKLVRDKSNIYIYKYVTQTR